MKYISTRQNKESYTLREAAFTGLAPCSGLYMPQTIPQVDMSEVGRCASIGYADLALYLANLFFADDIEPRKLESVVRTAYDFAPILHNFEPRDGSVGVRASALELFHGPTFAFKDYGARFMGGMLGAINDNDRDLTILTATSGDTGSAVASGFFRVPGVRVILLYPAGRVSPLQESQMTTLGANIHPMRVDGSFDDCQRMVKEIFADHDYCRRCNITSANSINILRWIPQSFYYFYGHHLWTQQHGSARVPDIVVPSGNYGNLSAGMLARRMGLPVGRFVAASNSNDVIPELLRGGEYQPRESLRTIANAMDVGTPSNYERMMSLVDGDIEALRAQVIGTSADDSAIRDAIAQVWQRYGYRIDPHSAIGYIAATELDIDGFWLSTAHEAKFREVLATALPAGVSDVSLPPALARSLELPRKYGHISARSGDLRAVIENLEPNDR